MALKIITCPECEEQIQIDDQAKRNRCAVCGSVIVRNRAPTLPEKAKNRFRRPLPRPRLYCARTANRKYASTRPSTKTPALCANAPSLKKADKV